MDRQHARTFVLSSLSAMIFCAATLGGNLIRSDEVKLNRLSLGKSTFEEAMKLFGPTKPFKTGDAGNAEEKICYSFDGTNIKLILARDSEMSTEGVFDQIRFLK